MKKLLGVMLGFLTSACSTDSDAGRSARILLDYVRGNPQLITREQAAAVPYASMGMTIGSGPQGLLVLGAITPDQADWYAGERVFVATNRGQIVRTLGLPYDLGALRIESTTGEMKAPNRAISRSDRIVFDFPDLGIFNAYAQCSMRDAGEESVEILGATLPARHMVQHCEVPVLKWRFDNEFWEDPDNGQLWRSSQHIHPKSPPVDLVVLRPVQQEAEQRVAGTP